MLECSYSQVIDRSSLYTADFTRLIGVAYHASPPWQGATLTFSGYGPPMAQGTVTVNWDFRAFDPVACAGCLIDTVCYNDGDDNPTQRMPVVRHRREHHGLDEQSGRDSLSR